jgi:alpha,alpha-trehalase
VYSLWSSNSIVKCLLFTLGIGVFSSCASLGSGPNTALKIPELYRGYGELFVCVQEKAVFGDSKVFVDAVPRYSPSKIRSLFRSQNPKSKENIKHFVEENFSLPRDSVKSKVSEASFKNSTESEIAQHLQNLWSVLERPSDKLTEANSSLIPLPHSYVVPGGRFREIYYWDSYFTELGLLVDRRYTLFKNLVRNFQYLVLKLGRIPNGNRIYYSGRSQPPFFSHMVALWRFKFGMKSALQFLPALQTEYNFWMAGQENLDPGEAAARVVRLADGVLNRYSDDDEGPRPESFSEDLATAKQAAELLHRPASEVFHDLRSGAESGWDFSSRWFKDTRSLVSIQTSLLLPIDLNSLLYHMELTLAELYRAKGDLDEAKKYQGLAAERRRLIRKWLWNKTSGTFRDYNWKTKSISTQDTVAMVVPLFTGVATDSEAHEVSLALEKYFLKPGGLVTTNVKSGQQWDAPNGWAPHQWMAYVGLRRYGETRLAQTIRERWLALNRSVFRSTGKFVEKYNVEDLNVKAGGGEYPTQDGFGWTNGVYRALSFPEAIEVTHSPGGQE